MMYLASSGSVPPMNIVGSASVESETGSVNPALTADRAQRYGVRTGVQTDHLDRNRVTASDTTLTLSSRAAYARSGWRTRSASRPPSQLPSDSPRKKLATVTLTANVELPSTNCNCLNQITW